MSEAELYKFFSSYDGEADLSDFTPEELARLLSEQGEAEKNFKKNISNITMMSRANR